MYCPEENISQQNSNRETLIISSSEVVGPEKAAQVVDCKLFNLLLRMILQRGILYQTSLYIDLICIF